MKQACMEAGGVLVNDKPLIPASDDSNQELAELLSPLVAFQCLSLSFPCNNALDPIEILEARYELNDEWLTFATRPLITQ